MTLKKDMKHPNFVVGLLSYLLFLTGVVLQLFNSVLGLQIILVSIVMGGIHWIGSLIDVCTDPELKRDEQSRYLWLSIVIMIPPIAGMMYYMMNRKIISF
jgi:hypothetical protein